jgi:hypothetical protein
VIADRNHRFWPHVQLLLIAAAPASGTKVILFAGAATTTDGSDHLSTGDNRDRSEREKLRRRACSKFRVRGSTISDSIPSLARNPLNSFWPILFLKPTIFEPLARVPVALSLPRAPPLAKVISLI